MRLDAYKLAKRFYRKCPWNGATRDIDGCKPIPEILREMGGAIRLTSSQTRPMPLRRDRLRTNGVELKYKLCGRNRINIRIHIIIKLK